MSCLPSPGKANQSEAVSYSRRKQEMGCPATCHKPSGCPDSGSLLSLGLLFVLGPQGPPGHPVTLKLREPAYFDCEEFLKGSCVCEKD